MMIIFTVGLKITKSKKYQNYASVAHLVIFVGQSTYFNTASVI